MAGEWLAYGEISLAAMGLAPFALHRLSCGQWAKHLTTRTRGGHTAGTARGGTNRFGPSSLADDQLEKREKDA